jgi:PAS domain S-box-containing protein
MRELQSPQSSTAAARSRAAVRLATAVVALFGLTVLIAWHAHWTSLLQILPDSTAIKFNTAVCFILCSVGILLLTTRCERFAIVCGGVAIVIAMVTLLEYLTSLPIDIDQLFVRDYIFFPLDFPGRMAQLTAGCFALLGVALSLAAEPRRRRQRLIVIASLTCIVAVISAFALFGYIFGIEEAYGWGAYTRMAPHTAAAFLALSLTLLEWTRQSARAQKLDLLAWLPVIASVTMMSMVAFVSTVSLAHVRSSFEWSRHSYIVLLNAHALFVDITDIQRGARDYVLTGKPEVLEPYAAGVKNAALQLAELRTITVDNVAQIPWLNRLAADITHMSAHAGRLIELRDSQGTKAALRLESTGEGRSVTNRARLDLQTFTDAERALLVRRNARALHNLFNTSSLLALASAVAIALLMWAHFRGTAETYRRRRVEAALQKLSSLQTAILNAANYAIISSSADGIITTFNSTAERWLGYSADEIVGKAAPAAWYDADEVVARAQSVTEELGYSVSGAFETMVGKARLGQREENEWTMIRKDGSRFPIWRSVTAQIDAGTIVGYVSVLTDLTERKKHEAEARLSEERFRRAFDDAPIGMSLVDTAGRWLRVNRAFCQLLGYSSAELLATDIQSVTHPDDRASGEAIISRALAGTDPPSRIEKRYVHRDGDVVFTELNVSLVRDATGKPLYFISQIEDVTGRREVERMKSEFISTVSHELRTPLTSIRGALGLIDAGVLGELPREAQAMVAIAHQNSERLVRIINDILDVDKIGSGKLAMQIESMPVAEFLEKAAAFHQPYGAKHEVRFVVEAPSVCANVLADPHRLMQVIANLLSNAAKFSPPGAEVRVRAVQHGARVRIEVQDRGTGIPEAFRAHVFEKFAQADSSTSRRFAGTGLGLSITRGLLKAMHGTIDFETATGRGTTFYFELPCAAPAPLAPQCVSAPESARYKVLNSDNAPRLAVQGPGTPRVLHVEDDMDLSRVIETALAGRADLVSAGTLEAAEKLLRESSFSLLVLDLELPDGNGLSLLEELPALTASPIPVVILSATEVSQEVKQRVAAALVKSRVSEAHIVDTLLSLLPQALSPSPAAALSLPSF